MITEMEKLEKELEEIELRLKGDFINPMDMRRKDEILSLLLTKGETSEVRFIVKKGRKSQRVTSFTRDHR